MAGRPKIFDEQEIIDKAIEVFFLKGYEATSANDLLKAMNIGQGSFYLAFKGGKKELFEKTLDRFSDKAIVHFNMNLENAENPVEYLKDFFLSLADSPVERKLKGCYLGNAIIEMSNTDIRLKDKAIKLLQRLEECFRKIIESAQEKALIHTKESPEFLAKYLINLWNGVNVSRRIYIANDDLRKIIKMNLKILE